MRLGQKGRPYLRGIGETRPGLRYKDGPHKPRREVVAAELQKSKARIVGCPSLEPKLYLLCNVVAHDRAHKEAEVLLLGHN